MRLVIRDEPTGPWHQLEGECDAEWQALEGAAAQGARTSGPSSEAEAAFVEAVTRLCCSLRVVRQSAGCVRATEGRVDQPAVLGIRPSGPTPAPSPALGGVLRGPEPGQSAPNRRPSDARSGTRIRPRIRGLAASPPTSLDEARHSTPMVPKFPSSLEGTSVGHWQTEGNGGVTWQPRRSRPSALCTINP